MVCAPHGLREARECVRIRDTAAVAFTIGEWGRHRDGLGDDECHCIAIDSAVRVWEFPTLPLSSECNTITFTI